MNRHLISAELKDKIFDALSGGDRDSFDENANEAWAREEIIDGVSRDFSVGLLRTYKSFELCTSFDDDEQADCNTIALCVADGVGLIFHISLPGYCDENYDARVNVSAFPAADFDAEVKKVKTDLVANAICQLERKLGEDFRPLVLAALKPAKPKRKKAKKP